MPIQVLVVDDSVLFRTKLQLSLGSEGDIKVIGCAISAADAAEKLELLKPDVITLDIEMPGENGIDFLKELMPRLPIPVVVVSSLYSRTMDALAAGAVEFVRKPEAGEPNAFDRFVGDLQEKIRIAAKAQVHSSPKAAAPSLSAKLARKTTLPPDQRLVIAIGASTGGTEAILAVVKDLPATMPGIVIVQHMPANFTRLYAERLDKLCAMHVKEAQDRDRVVQGQILIAAGEFHMRLRRDTNGYYVQCQRGERVSGHCPSVDVLFDSVAETAGKDAIGVLLTGMGADGAKGLLKMRQADAYTIGQDKASCVVYGMPMEAYKLGAVCRQLPLDSIPDELIYSISKRTKPASAGKENL